MPSPFPGMDPYLETPMFWAGFHNSLANEIQAQINARVQPKYFARLEAYVTYEIITIGEQKRKSVRPDVTVWQKAAREVSAAYATIAPAPFESEVEIEVPLDLMRVEIHSVALQQVITVIEILSPVNKRLDHPAHLDYLRKRAELLRSPVHRMEIDFLRGGERPPLQKPIPDAPYYLFLSRANRRPRVEVWALQLTDKLPVVPVPLFEPDPDVPLDLNTAVATVYERGAYAAQIDYSEPAPSPPLSEQEQATVNALLNVKR